MLCSTKPSKAVGDGISASLEVSQTSAILPIARQHMRACVRGEQTAMLSLSPKHLTAIFEPFIQRLKVCKCRGHLPQTLCCKHAFGVMARIANILLNLAFLLASRRIAELWFKNTMAGYRQKTRIHIALLISTNSIHCHLRLHCPRTNGGQFPLS